MKKNLLSIGVSSLVLAILVVTFLNVSGQSSQNLIQNPCFVDSLDGWVNPDTGADGVNGAYTLSVAGGTKNVTPACPDGYAAKNGPVTFNGNGIPNVPARLYQVITPTGTTLDWSLYVIRVTDYGWANVYLECDGVRLAETAVFGTNSWQYNSGQFAGVMCDGTLVFGIESQWSNRLGWKFNGVVVTDGTTAPTPTPTPTAVPSPTPTPGCN
ncbi:MAG: hypothetical protein D6706_14885 [Chloroflexi bacterium]|nr:MAG: hypothetical protein D6706_14885 [Chloroflexota bacterium]